MSADHEAAQAAATSDTPPAVNEMCNRWDGCQLKRLERELHAAQQAALPEGMVPCKGKNCGSTDYRLHSADCFAEHEATINPNGMYDDEVRVPTALFAEIVASIPSRREPGSLYQRLNAMLAAAQEKKP